MANVVFVAQISDAHLRVGAGDGASGRALEAAVRSVAALDPAPQAVLISGDLVDSGAAAEYERARDLLSPLTMPVLSMAGNHDDRDLLRSFLGGPAAAGRAGDRVQYAARVDPLRLVVCDTVLPGRNEGDYGPARLDWLAAELGREPRTLTIVAMHHPPVLTGIGVIDQFGLPAADRRAIAQLIARSPQVRRIVAGHLHRTMVGSVVGCAVFVCPSSHQQLHLASSFADRIALTCEPPGFALHVVTGDDVVSHAQPIGDYEVLPG
jgi:Icc protein